MSDSTVPLFERRLDSHQKLKELVRARTHALVSFSKLASMRPFRPNQAVRRMLCEFCEALTAYTGAGHGLLYRFVEEGIEKRQEVRVVAERTYPRIAETTARMLRFIDAYGCTERCGNLSQLAEDLSELGEFLADRILLEDKLLDLYLGRR